MKKILLLVIGCDYKDSKYKLGGCINDAIDVSQTIIDITENTGDYVKLKLLTDNNRLAFPSKKNIITSIKKGIKQCNRGNFSNFIFYFAGHGFQKKDLNSEESDKLDETIFTADHKFIKDDEFRKILLGLNNRETNVSFIFDCCHSGSILDLPVIGIGKKSESNIFPNNNSKIICISACDDAQTSKEVRGRGIFTQNLTSILRRKGLDKPIYHNLIHLNQILKAQNLNMSLTYSGTKNINFKDTGLSLIKTKRNYKKRGVRIRNINVNKVSNKKKKNKKENCYNALYGKWKKPKNNRNCQFC